MVKMVQSLRHWLWTNHRETYSLILFGHVELFTEEMKNDYLNWCQTEEGRQYQKGGSKYREEGDTD